MSKIVNTLFGDKGKGAAKQQAQQNAQERQFIVDQTQQAQNILRSMYPTMQQNTMLGGQAALTTLRNAMPQAAYQRQQGTQNAIAALLGGQGAPIQSNQNYIPQNLPSFQMYGAAQPITVNQQQQIAPSKNDLILQALRGSMGRG